LESTLVLAADFAARAKGALAPFAASDWRDGLEGLADFAVTRRA
jgi:octaprenyl-diphosphate synthase